MTNHIWDQAAQIVEPYLTGTFKRAERAAGAVGDLEQAGLLAGQTPTVNLPPQEAAVNLLQCRFSWPNAEKIAAELAAQGLLAEKGTR